MKALATMKELPTLSEALTFLADVSDDAHGDDTFLDLIERATILTSPERNGGNRTQQDKLAAAIKIIVAHEDR